MSSKAEIFASILADVSRETEVPEDVITSASRNAEAVEARWILVKLLRMQGFYPSIIAPLISHKRRAVTHMLSNFDDKMEFSPLMKLCFNNLKAKWGGGKNIALTKRGESNILKALASSFGSFAYGQYRPQPINKLPSHGQNLCLQF